MRSVAGSLRRAALGMAIGLGTAVAVAQPPPVATSPAGLAAEASDALKRMSATIAAAASFTVRITSTREERLASGQSALLGATGVVAVRRPEGARERHSGEV
jgi:hypothetical protein